MKLLIVYDLILYHHNIYAICSCVFLFSYQSLVAILVLVINFNVANIPLVVCSSVAIVGGAEY